MTQETKHTPAQAALKELEGLHDVKCWHDKHYDAIHTALECQCLVEAKEALAAADVKVGE